MNQADGVVGGKKQHAEDDQWPAKRPAKRPAKVYAVAKTSRKSSKGLLYFVYPADACRTHSHLTALGFGDTTEEAAIQSNWVLMYLTEHRVKRKHLIRMQD